jgi:hypothetical protein
MTINNRDLPAMPVAIDSATGCEGLTKREMFAMSAMQGLIVSCWKDVDLYESASDLLKNIAESSVEHADALLAELERTK